jgi:hypothetical protein
MSDRRSPPESHHLTPDQILELRLRQQRQRPREDLFYFTWGAFDVLHRSSGTRYHPNYHVNAICHQLTRCYNGDNRRLLITIPPRHLKTITASVAFPAFVLGHDPSKKIVVASYARDLTDEIQRQLKMVMESTWYRRLFPKTRIKTTGFYLKTDRGGSVKFTSVGGSVTGHGADITIVDDLMKANEAQSQTIRDETYAYYRGALLSRFNDQQSGIVIAIQQRLHEDDLAGRLIETGNYFHLNLPATSIWDAKLRR